MSDPNSPTKDPGHFVTTQWSIVVSAGQPSSSDSRQALESLCQTYWHPLYAYVRHRVSDVNEAQDLTQAFFTELLEKNYVGAADAERGRFRAFLITAFKNFLSKYWEKGKAQKRGGGQSPISLDFATAESGMYIDPESKGLTAEQYFDQQWAISLLNETLNRLEAEMAEKGKAVQYVELKGYIIGDSQGVSYAAAAQKLNMTVDAAKKSASRMRERYRELLREQIAQTVEGPAEIEAEIRSLFDTFGS